MAIDTRAKRVSIMNRTMPWRGLLPVPSGSFSAGDRAQLLYKYSQTWTGVVASLGIKIISLLMEGALQMELGMEGALDLTLEME